MSQTSPNTLHYVDDVLHWGKDCNLSQWQEQAGEAPVFLYNLSGIKHRYQQMRVAWGCVSSSSKIFYAMKANSFPEILSLFKQLGSGIDVVSAGEIQRAVQCGFSGKDIIFSGVGKSKSEIEFAIDAELYQLNVESLPELHRVAEISLRKKKSIPIVLRMNPNVDVKTHPYIATGLSENKFGIEISLWPEIKSLLKLHPQLQLLGLSLHLGSQMLEFSGFAAALRWAKDFFLQMKREFPTVHRFDVGGGLGILYEKQDFPAEEKFLSDYVDVAQSELKDLLQDPSLEIQSEPGRWLVAHSGVLLTEIEYLKETPQKKFLIVNAGMHLLLRPALYQAYHRILPLHLNVGRPSKVYDVVGPICESSDFLAKNRQLPDCHAGEVLVIADVGAYGAAMSSNYNLQKKPFEICLK